MRLVLDTNVVLSALLWRGAPYRLLEQIRGQTDIQLYSSPALIEELREVLTRPSPAGRLGLIGMTAPEALLDYVDAVTIVAPASVPRVVPDDSDDDQVIAAAVSARADLIVSGDRHLLAIASYDGISIVNPAQALERICAPRP